ncbi:hypothetical protein HYPSUDRAFT_207266 [Hypholoma sublateritium FD-334 SS-4]|uniref:Uncharacterized protein n=1 Tax=Hypholoma sublateritium (strain FD-334 SS-4) TaxID=945553 RepID=A0A0D2P755_HYPSF|nr:hypothetical protein HYPSUDRAFT_207266 [Hypholoma sublateritium FD-334 SS-4]
MDTVFIRPVVNVFRDDRAPGAPPPPFAMLPMNPTRCRRYPPYEQLAALWSMNDPRPVIAIYSSYSALTDGSPRRRRTVFHRPDTHIRPCPLTSSSISTFKYRRTDTDGRLETAAPGFRGAHANNGRRERRSACGVRDSSTIAQRSDRAEISLVTGRPDDVRPSTSSLQRVSTQYLGSEKHAAHERASAAS